MKRALQILAVLIVVATVFIWALKGSNAGWTKTQVQVWTVDEITEIRSPEWKNQFVPGADFLCSGLLVATGLAVASRFIRTNNKPITSKQNQA